MRESESCDPHFVIYLILLRKPNNKVSQCKIRCKMVGLVSFLSFVLHTKIFMISPGFKLEFNAICISDDESAKKT